MSIEWNGEGLPPIGCECELVNFFGNDFPDFVGEPSEVVKIIGNGFTNGCPVAFFEANGGRAGMLAYAVEQCFRPVRTEAELRCESAIEALSQVVEYRSGCNHKAMARWLYEAISAGKIPHITLK